MEVRLCLIFRVALASDLIMIPHFESFVNTFFKKLLKKFRVYFALICGALLIYHNKPLLSTLFLIFFNLSFHLLQVRKKQLLNIRVLLVFMILLLVF